MFKKFAVFIPVFVLGSLFAVLPLTAQKRKVTVMDFGYATVKTQVQAYFGTDQDIGKGISDLLIAQLLDGGEYRVIERSALDKILKEQNFSNSDRANPATAAKIGGLLGVDAMIIGDITAFGNDDKHYGGSSAGCAVWHGCGVGGLGISKKKVIVEITARMVDVNTGEILASVTGRGEVEKSGVTGGGGGNNGWSGGGGQFDMGSSNFQQSAIGQATKQSVAQVATGLDTKASVIPPPTVVAAPVAPPPPPLDGVIADASTADVILNVGSKEGVKIGDSLNVMREGKVIKDPVTGKVLRIMETPIGTLSVTSVDPDSSIGKFTGTGKPQVGDHVKRPPAS
jgi:curli biogenesis system outer membrane secretion channel CsgG